jgi:hypothetical protein
VDDLMQEGIDALIKFPDTMKCTGALKKGEMHCIEGVFAQVLINHYPDRFSWIPNGEPGEFRMRDNTRIGSLNERPLSYHALLPDHWNLLHPNGSYIATMVAAAFGYSYVASVNDFTGIEFRYVGERFQRLKDRIGTKQRCDVCAMIVPLDSEEHRLCPTCAEVEARRKEVLSWK